MEYFEDKETIVINKDGKNIECDVLFTFESDDTEKLYICCTDNTFDENGHKNIYPLSFDPILGTGLPETVTDSKELEMVNDVMIKIKNAK